MNVGIPCRRSARNVASIEDGRAKRTLRPGRFRSSGRGRQTFAISRGRGRSGPSGPSRLPAVVFHKELQSISTNDFSERLESESTAYLVHEIGGALLLAVLRTTKKSLFTMPTLCFKPLIPLACVPDLSE